MDPGLLFGEKYWKMFSILKNLKSNAIPSPGQELGGKGESKEGDGHEQGKTDKLGHSSQPGVRSISEENSLKYIDYWTQDPK